MSPNWHGVIAGAIGAVNPATAVSLHASTGFTIQPDGTPTPNFTVTSGQCDVQAFDLRNEAELRHLASLGIEGILRKVYAFGTLAGLVRVNETGGDFLVIAAGPHAGTWKVVHVYETWPGWTAAVIQLQVEGV